jgi:cation:H+ antiporter
LATVVVASAREAPGIAFGDIIGSNIAVCLVALAVGAIVAGGIPFSTRVFVYAAAAVPVSALSVLLLWDARLTRLEGAVLVGLYVLYVAAIWKFERAPPILGEVEELIEAEAEVGVAPPGRQGRIGKELGLVLAGLAAMAAGSVMLVEAVRQITDIESTQTRLGLTVVGFATAFELVMLVWSASRRGATDVALAGVVGSFGYNMTMSLGAGALVRPMVLADASSLRLPAAVMIVLFAGVIALALPTRRLERPAGIALICAYPLFVVAVAM